MLKKKKKAKENSKVQNSYRHKLNKNFLNTLYNINVNIFKENQLKITNYLEKKK